MNNKIKLTVRELDVMNVLWEANEAMIAKDIADKNTSLNINTVQAVLKSLLKKEYIKIDAIVYSGTVLTRSYVPILTVDEYMLNQINTITNKSLSPEGIMVALLKQDNDNQTIQKLEKILHEYRENQKKGI